MDLSTRYLGFELDTPFVVGASPLGDALDSAKALEDAGAAAIVVRSLFEEQLTPRRSGADGAPRTAESALAYLPRDPAFAFERDAYLELLRRYKESLAMPVVASLNGASLGGWLAHARQLEQAGADALELNLYRLAADPAIDPRALEERELEMVAALCDAVLIPVAVKLSPFYTALARFAGALDRAGAAGLVLFNRFYQADIDLETLELRSSWVLSSSDELLLRLRWLAITRGSIRGSLAATGGVHTAEDVLKATLCGADAVQIVSALLRHGPGRLISLRRELEEWLERHECDALSDLIGAMSLERCPDPSAFERAQYLWTLHGAGPADGEDAD